MPALFACMRVGHPCRAWPVQSACIFVWIVPVVRGYLCCGATHTRGHMATREPPVELFYDPADLDPTAPRLRVMRNGVGWELWDADGGVLLGRHPSQADAIEAALERSKVRFSEILVRGSNGRLEWLADQEPASMRLTRLLNEAVESQRRRAREA
jgi:hypothetical protein